MQYLRILNYGTVLIFGVVLTLSFSGVNFREKKKDYFIIPGLFGLAQVTAYYLIGEDILFKSYPLLIHLPLFLILRYFYKKRVLLSGIAVMSAYLFCTPRKWFGTFVSFFWNYNETISYAVQIAVTFPLLIVIIRYISPYVSQLKFEENKVLGLFISVPMIYYVMEYGLTVYSDLLYQGGAAVVEFMDASIVVIYFIFSIVYLKTLYEKKEIEVEQAILKIITNQSQHEIEALRRSQKQAAIFRHDLRHHLNYLNACISENRSGEALRYIESTCKDIDNFKVIRYCENESINLILSAYNAKAAERDIRIEFIISAADFSRFAIPDLCSLLSNALDNAINACAKKAVSDERFIKMRLYNKNSKLCIEVQNSYNTELLFDKGLPVSKDKEHGMGIKSMVYIVEKSQGIYQFTAKDGIFVFQAAL